MKIIKRIYRKLFFEFTEWGRGGYKREDMKPYYWEGN